MKFQPIPKRSGVTPQEFQETFLEPGKPVVFTDLVKDWPAIEKWTFDWFKKNYGHLEVPLCGNDFHNSGKGYMAFTRHMKFGEYLDLIQSQPTDLRMFAYDIFKVAPELRADFFMPNVMDGWHPNYSYMFFGGEGSKVNLHYDIDCGETFLTQFQTRKRVVIFPQHSGRYLYQEPFTVKSLVDIDQPDYGKYPALQYLEGYETILEHGETIYIPTQNWHYIEYIDGGFGMNIRAHNGLANQLKGLTNIARHFVLDKGMNKLLGEKWSEWKKVRAFERAEQVLHKQVA